MPGRNRGESDHEEGHHLTRLRRVEHTETPRGLSLNAYIYINKSGSGTVRIGRHSQQFGNIGQGIAIMAELMGKKAVVAARQKD